MSTEQHRLKAVARFKQLNESISKDLNDIVTLAAQICNAPIALVTLIDEDMQWFRAAVGTEVTCVTRKLSLCNFTIKSEGLLTIPDTTLDERFNNHPRITGEPFVRFYAGIPLLTKDNLAIGTLCIMDFKPRSLDKQQQNSLSILSRQVISLMELQWNLKALTLQHQKMQEQKSFIEDSEIKLKAIFDSSKDTHILVGKNLEVLAFNKSASDFVRTTYKKKLSTGDCIIDYTDPGLIKQFTKNFAYALAGRVVKREWMLMPGTVYACWKETSFIPVKNGRGEVMGIALNSTDITTRKRQEEQISTQNEALTRIAIIQSHELRRPVASLLGLMDLMKLEHIDFGYFNILEITVNELDEKIRSIVKDSEDTIHGPRLAIVA
jgi:PAS domain S-box-containing protein